MTVKVRWQESSTLHCHQHYLMRQYLTGALLLLVFGGPLAPPLMAQHDHHPQPSITIPKALEAEHDAIHRDLAAIIARKGKTGAAAEQLADALHEHFAEEQEYGMPPLGILKDVAAGRITREVEHAAIISEKLDRELPKMLAEHRIIMERIDALRIAARDEQRDDALSFADKLALHAQYEEDVLYPAAILVGKYLELLRQKNKHKDHH